MDALGRITAGAPPLHTAELSRLAVPNRVFAAVYASALLILFSRHIITLTATKSLSSLFVSLSLFAADLVLAFMWATTQAYRMRPLRRSESPELLKKAAAEAGDYGDHDFPAMDVFICTADPYKEPPVGTVNTALSVMAYEYPPEKISVYISDDGGSAVALFALLEAAKFAAHWLPFCRQNGVVRRSPEEFFAAANESSLSSEAMKIKTLYQIMKTKVDKVVHRGKVSDDYITTDEHRQALGKWTDGFTRTDHPTVIQVILDKSKDRDVTNQVMPNLIYVSREKNRASIHHFKGGALNVLIRVSATMSNAPMILTLDCDMSSNDPETPLRALCYFSDQKLQSEVGYVQFPQHYRGINKNDIYGCELKRVFLMNAQGMDGLLGPNYMGTGTFFSRRAFFGGPSAFVPPESPELSPKTSVVKPIQSPEVLKLAHCVAGSNYESNTQWGCKIGVRYGSLSEDMMTGYHMQCEGWKSIFCNPERPAFYGDAPTSLLDALTQIKRWAVGQLQLGYYKYGPLTFGVTSMGPLMGLVYAHYAFWHILSVPVTIYAFLPQLALLNGITIFPKVSEPWFVLYIFLFLGAYGQDLLDFLVGGGTIQRWWNDQRMWLIRCLSSFFFASIDFISKSLGISTFNFTVTSKVLDEKHDRLYEQGVFEFGVHSPLFVTLTMAAIINAIALIWGLVTVYTGKNDFSNVLMQLLIVAFAVVNCRPVYEAMIFRVNKGGIPIKTTLTSTILVFALIAIAFVTLS